MALGSDDRRTDTTDPNCPCGGFAVRIPWGRVSSNWQSSLLLFDDHRNAQAKVEAYCEANTVLLFIRPPDFVPSRAILCFLFPASVAHSFPPCELWPWPSGTVPFPQSYVVVRGDRSPLLRASHLFLLYVAERHVLPSRMGQALVCEVVFHETAVKVQRRLGNWKLVALPTSPVGQDAVP